MNRFVSILLAALCCLCAAGCLRSPQPTGYVYSTQQKIQAAHHWEVLAADLANRINMELIERGYLLDSVYVRHSCGRPDQCGPGETFPFDEGFNDLLVSQLVHFGVPTRVEPEEDSLVVDYKVQVLYHQDPAYQWPPPGALTALTGAIVVLHHAPADILALALAGAVDAARTTSVINGHYEVIITTSIVDNNRYIMRSSDIYYINDADFWQYRQATPAAEIELTGS
ncbi:hypothetical protein [Desulfogranum mediterraneum]|uniref:hypothetical protein n=1 Tax=Desulfogranum mediterraneum TaxID=160661 RepID=UPI0004130BBB|nr:hypothetical protein [Desulfogranum mediterraneum]